MDQTIRHTVDYYVIFKKTSLRHWVFKFLDKEMQHCYAVKESDGGQFWVIVESKNCLTEVRLESKINYPHIRCLEPNSVILSVRAKIDTSTNRNVLCVFNCVEQVKSLLGIRDFWLWTPYQLYKRLIRYE